MPNYKSMKKSKSFAKQMKGLFLSFIAVGITCMAIVLIFLFVNGVANDTKFTTENDKKTITAEVKEHQSTVKKQLKKQGLEEYTGLVLALMMQESGGRGEDPMQASESLCGEVGCIDDPEVSIKQGIDHFSNVLEKANGDVKLALQSYNFGAGFISYVNEHGGEYTKDLAIDFSAMKYKELADTGKYSCLREEALQYDACYGDIKYVDAVLAYYDDAKNLTAGEDHIVALDDKEEK